MHRIFYWWNYINGMEGKIGKEAFGNQDSEIGN
jgi:hypothetical protein